MAQPGDGHEHTPETSHKGGCRATEACTELGTGSARAPMPGCLGGALKKGTRQPWALREGLLEEGTSNQTPGTGELGVAGWKRVSGRALEEQGQPVQRPGRENLGHWGTKDSFGPGAAAERAALTEWVGEGPLSGGRAGRKGQTNSGRTCPRQVHRTTGLALNRAPQIGPSELWEVAGETELQYPEMTEVSKQESLSTWHFSWGLSKTTLPEYCQQLVSEPLQTRCFTIPTLDLYA